MFVKKLTPGTITISSFKFVQGEKVEVSDTLGKYIAENFSTAFEIYGEPEAEKPKTRRKKSTQSEG